MGGGVERPLACLHSGVFTRTQWKRFLGCHTETVRRAVHALIAQGMAAEERVPGIAGICRIHGCEIYWALGTGDIRRRRIALREVLTRRRRLSRWTTCSSIPTCPGCRPNPSKSGGS